MVLKITRNTNANRSRYKFLTNINHPRWIYQTDEVVNVILDAIRGERGEAGGRDERGEAGDKGGEGRQAAGRSEGRQGVRGERGGKWKRGRREKGGRGKGVEDVNRGYVQSLSSRIYNNESSFVITIKS